MVIHKRTRLSLLVANTQKALFVFLGGTLCVLGLTYLFATNHVAFRGYVLQRELETNQDLKSKLDLLQTKIARRETQEVLAETDQVKAMEDRQNKKFVIVRAPNITAQLQIKESSRNILGL